MERYIQLTGCLLILLITNLSIAFEFPACEYEQLINQLQAMPLEDQLDIFHQVIQGLPPQFQPVPGQPVNQQPNIQQQQLQEILQMLQDALHQQQEKQENPMDKMD